MSDEIEKLKKEIDLHCDFNNYLLEEIEKAGKEIERLKNQNKSINEVYELTKKEYIRLNNIIKEVRELLKNDYFEDGSFTNYEKVFELLDKENK